ncbi:hypothetical protein K474DRAFT_1710851 [Panus rudis PR-1116 ss-1]|nr:hypothetical protein K474DRAFT_1710851 [Panus rudis PR-1116 ss-1]
MRRVRFPLSSVASTTTEFDEASVWWQTWQVSLENRAVPTGGSVAKVVLDHDTDGATHNDTINVMLQGTISRLLVNRTGTTVVLPVHWGHECVKHHLYVPSSSQLHKREADHSIDKEDIADDKYFRKANDSDATQSSIVFPSIGVHGIYLDAIRVCSLIGFVLLGTTCFKQTPYSDEDRSWHVSYVLSLLPFEAKRFAYDYSRTERCTLSRNWLMTQTDLTSSYLHCHTSNYPVPPAPDSSC